MKRYRGKYTRRSAMPLASWILILLAVLSLFTGGVTAYLAASTGSVENTFKAEDPTDPSIVETFADNVKSDVSIHVGNPGYSVYVRAAIVFTWKNGNNVLSQAPVEGDYSLSIGNKWTKGSDGYYYYQDAVPSGQSTDPLIISCQPRTAAPVDGYTLSVDIIAQTIQVLGTTDDDDTPAVEDAWGVSVSDSGSLNPS